MSDENQAQAPVVPTEAGTDQSVAPDNTNTTATPADGQVASPAADVGTVPATDTPPAEVPATPADVVPNTDAEMNPPAAPEAQPTGEPLPEYAQADPAREDVPEIIEVETRVVYEGQNVAAVLRDGKELRTPDGLQITHYHCQFPDGTTKHVPVELFR